MWRATLCVLLCLAAALQGAKAPIRIMGSLGASPPIAPFARRWNPFVPCEVVVDEGDQRCNKGGYPSAKAWLANLSSDARGTVKFMTPDYRSRTVLAHPDGLMLNHAVWRHLDIDFVTLRNEYLYVSRATDLELVHLMRKSPYPWVISDFIVDERFAHVSDLLDATHVKVVDGVSIGILVLWPNSVYALPLPRILPMLTRRLRDDGVDKIVAFVTGLGRVNGLESVSTPATALLAVHDIDVIVRDIAPDTLPYMQNGTTVLTAPPYSGFPTDLLVLDMVQDGSLWQYTLRVVSMLDRPVPLGDPVYLAAKQWMQGEMNRSVANDITITELTAPMPLAEESPGVYFCSRMDCEVGVLTTDAMKERAGTQLAIINSASARAGMGWPVGPVNRSTLWSTYPFVNAICRVNVSATLLVALINNGISHLLPDGRHDPDQRAGRFAQISGFRFTMNPKLPVGSRVVSVDVAQPDGTFEPLEKRRVYSLAVPKYLLVGGDGYAILGNHHGPSECLVTTMMEGTQDYLAMRKSYAPYIDGRIANDFDGVTLPMRNQSFGECSELEKHDPYWQDCVPCPAGFWRPDPTSNVCIERVSGGLNLSLVVGIVVGVAVAAAVPLGMALVAARSASRRARLQSERVRHAPRDANAHVAVVFTDIKRSTDLWAAHHAEMTIALQQHHSICRELIEQHHGYEVKTIGDAFMVAFASPVSAVGFMLDLQVRLLHAVWPEELLLHPACREEDGLFKGLRVRAGAHYGCVNIVETPTGGFDYDGTTCNLAARVSDSGDGGQIVVTEELYRAVEPHLDLLQCVPDVCFLGLYTFKGVPGDVPCYQVMPGELSGRLFDGLRNVLSPRHLSCESSEGGLHTSSTTKAQLTRAMQSLRLWVTRDSQGIPFAQLNSLLAAGTKGNTVLQHLVSLAILRVFATRVDGSTIEPGVTQTRVTFLSDDSISSYSDTFSNSGFLQDTCTAFRWPVVAEILRSLPAELVLSLAACTGNSALNSASISPLEAPRNVLLPPDRVHYTSDVR